MTESDKCAYCGASTEGKRAIHRDGFGEGPEVALCNEHGSYKYPSPEDIWVRIAERRAAGIQIGPVGS